jgi:hypothetical protein
MTNMTPQQRAKHILDALKNRRAQALNPNADGRHLFKADQEPEFKSHEWLDRKTA